MANKTKAKQSKRKANAKTEQAEIIVTRQDEQWVFVREYLEILNNSIAIYDQEFTNKFNQLLDYVYSKIEWPENGGDILDSCYMVWQKANVK